MLGGDVAKGALASGAGLAVAGRPLAVACRVAAVVGHVLPVTRLRHGGKGVATAAGLLVVVEPSVALGSGVVWAIAFAITRVAAVASLAGCASVVVALAILGRPGGEVGALGAAAMLVVARHGGNLSRLRRGEERPIERGAAP